jgi:hypothetical protein
VTARCDLTELLVEDCAHCRGNDKTIEEQATAERLELRARLLSGAVHSITSWFPARYPGHCAGCGTGFGEGTAIRTLALGYLAECCAEDVTT